MGEGDEKNQPPKYSHDILSPPEINAPGKLVWWDSTQTTAKGAGKYTIFGADTQVLQVELQPGETFISEPGAMLYRGKSVIMKTNVGGFTTGVKRSLGGESFFRNNYTNNGSSAESITVTPSFPAKIIPIELEKSGPIHVSPGLYLGSIGDVTVTFKFVRNVLAGCFGGGGFLLLRIKGTGTVFLEAGGTIMEKILAPEEELLVDTNSLVGFSETAKYGVQRVRGCLTCCCGGEGLFNTKITGPGLVIVQSMSQTRLRQALFMGAGGANSGGSGGGGEGGAA